MKEDWEKMSIRIDGGNREKWLSAIKKFYEVAETRSYEDLPPGVRTIIESNDESIKSFCRDLCLEAINRDFCSLLSTGDVGPVGREVYESLL